MRSSTMTGRVRDKVNGPSVIDAVSSHILPLPILCLHTDISPSLAPPFNLVPLSLSHQPPSTPPTPILTPPSRPSPPVREEDIGVIFNEAGARLRKPEVDALVDRFAVGDRGEHLYVS